MTVEFDEAAYLANQVEDARQRAVLASADAEQAKLDAQAAEYAAREATNRSTDIIRQANQAVTDAQAAAAQAQAPTDEMVADLAKNPASLTRDGIDLATGAMITEDGSATQAAGDARWLISGKSDVGLGNVDNTSDANKPVSIAQAAAIAAIDAKANASASVIAKSTDPLAYLDNVKLFAKFPVREGGQMAWVQGFTIMPEEGVYYVSNQQGASLRIDQRTIGTDSRTLQRTTATEDNAYSESIDSFRNGSGHLMAVVWPKAMSFPNAYALYNVSTSSLGPQIPINGVVRGARYGDIFVTCDVWGTNAPGKFYIYSWESIKAGTPELLQEVVCKAYPSLPAKAQGMAYNDGFIFFAQGSQAENMTITAYNMRGEIELIKTYSRASLMKTVNKLVPGLLDNPDYLFECEGAFSINGKLYTLIIVNNTPSVVPNAVALILEHNNIDGVKIESYVPALTTVGPWININLMAGWTHQAANPFQARVNGNRVEFQGFAINATHVGGYTTFATLPAGIPKPKQNNVYAVAGNTTAIRAISVWPGGDIQAYSSAATASWYGVGGGSYAY